MVCVPLAARFRAGAGADSSSSFLVCGCVWAVCMGVYPPRERALQCCRGVPREPSEAATWLLPLQVAGAAKKPTNDVIFCVELVGPGTCSADGLSHTKPLCVCLIQAGT